MTFAQLVEHPDTSRLRCSCCGARPFAVNPMPAEQGAVVIFSCGRVVRWDRTAGKAEVAKCQEVANG